jgi:hypothetical protein
MNRLCNTQSGIAIDQKPKQYAELQAVSKITSSKQNKRQLVILSNKQTKK